MVRTGSSAVAGSGSFPKVASVRTVSPVARSTSSTVPRGPPPSPPASRPRSGVTDGYEPSATEVPCRSVTRGGVVSSRSRRNFSASLSRGCTSDSRQSTFQSPSSCSRSGSSDSYVQVPRPVIGIFAVKGTARVPSSASRASPAAVSRGLSMSRPAVKLCSTFWAVPGLVVRPAALGRRPAAQSARKARACFIAAGSGPSSPRAKGPNPAA